MRSITRLFSAFGTLADSILSLAQLVDVAAGKLRQQLPVETGDAAHVIEHNPDAAEAPAEATNGRKRKATT